MTDEPKLRMFETTEKYVTPYLPPDALDLARQWEAKGQFNLVFPRLVPVAPEARCPNCQDVGYIYLSFTRAGPFEAPPGHGKGSAIFWHDGGPGIGKGWYISANTRAFVCPECQGSPEKYAADKANEQEQDDLPYPLTS